MRHILRSSLLQLMIFYAIMMFSFRLPPIAQCLLQCVEMISMLGNAPTYTYAISLIEGILLRSSRSQSCGV